MMSSKLKTFSLVALITFVGAFFRLYDLGRESLRLDETQTIWQASHSLDFIKNYSAQNVHLPLFNVMVNTWMRAGLTNETALRLLPVIFGIATLPFFYLLAREILKSSSNALIALLFASISPFLIWYSRELRPYSLLIFISVLSYLVFFKALNKPTIIKYLLLTALNILGLYTHYFFAIVMLIELLYALFTRAKILPLIFSFIITFSK